MRNPGDMSYITLGSETDPLVRNIWPGNVGSKDDLPPEFTFDLPWQRCPTTVEQLRNWGVFTHNPDEDDALGSPFVFTYKPGFTDIFPGRFVVEEVQIRFQGFVQSSFLSPIGSWNGHSDDASSAEKIVVLDGGRFSEIFNHQVRAVIAIGKLGIMSLSPREKESCYATMTERGLIKFRRPASAKKIKSVLDGMAEIGETEDDEEDEDDEECVEELRFQVRKVDGSKVFATWHVIRLNDFVEVEASVKVVQSEGCDCKNVILECRRRDGTSFTRMSPLYDDLNRKMFDDVDYAV
ncbi:hypothetical protein BV25DRAFT_1913063 [Artomyces pyxidatus]|uniref:Uncharacterized protein n=1 Tax=Artomyces pyxidatus TaxID=48021 RepID=A0ACB8TCG1_9AGAM|nr:hypothetical protein BV25DRAFT_1913063 [Artomyces pyxidatus]